MPNGHVLWTETISKIVIKNVNTECKIYKKCQTIKKEHIFEQGKVNGDEKKKKRELPIYMLAAYDVIMSSCHHCIKK